MGVRPIGPKWPRQLRHLPEPYGSQVCSRCGCLGTRRGKRFACEACGHEADADRNAADNLLLLGMSIMHPGGPSLLPSTRNDDGLLKAAGFSRGEVYDQFLCALVSSQMKNGVPMTAVRMPSGISTAAAARAKVSMSNK